MDYDVTESFPRCRGDWHPFSFDHHCGTWLNVFPFSVDDNFLPLPFFPFFQSVNDKFHAQEEFCHCESFCHVQVKALSPENL